MGIRFFIDSKEKIINCIYVLFYSHKKLRLLSSFSITHKIPLDVLVKFYLDLCINQINQKETETENNKFESSLKIIDFKKSKKNSSKPILKKQNNQIINNNSNKEKKQNFLGVSQIDYSNSFTRLFIGEIDPSSVRERYLSNIVVNSVNFIVSILVINYLHRYIYLYKKV